MDDINNDKVNEFYDMQCKQEINSIRNKPKKSLLENPFGIMEEIFCKGSLNLLLNLFISR